MTRVIQPDLCPMFGDFCRHASVETTTRPFTRVVRDAETGLFKPVGMGKKRAEIGVYCNDYGDYVENMHYCPIRWDKSKRGGVYNAKTNSNHTTMVVPAVGSKRRVRSHAVA